MFRNLSEVVLSGRPNTFASFSKAALKFSWQVQHFGRGHFALQAHHFGRGHRHFALQAEHFGRVVLRGFANHIVRAASGFDNVQIPWHAWHFVRCSEN